MACHLQMEYNWLYSPYWGGSLNEGLRHQCELYLQFAGHGIFFELLAAHRNFGGLNFDNVLGYAL